MNELSSKEGKLWLLLSKFPKLTSVVGETEFIEFPVIQNGITGSPEFN